jgi:hypothetical protein
MAQGCLFFDRETVVASSPESQNSTLSATYQNWVCYVGPISDYEGFVRYDPSMWQIEQRIGKAHRERMTNRESETFFPCRTIIFKCEFNPLRGKLNDSNIILRISGVKWDAQGSEIHWAESWRALRIWTLMNNQRSFSPLEKNSQMFMATT